MGIRSKIQLCLWDHHNRTWLSFNVAHSDDFFRAFDSGRRFRLRQRDDLRAYDDDRHGFRAGYEPWPVSRNLPDPVELDTNDFFLDSHLADGKLLRHGLVLSVFLNRDFGPFLDGFGAS